MPRYEKQGKKAVEYIDLRIDKDTVRTETGRVGGKPKFKQTKYTSERAAESRFARAVAAAKSKGFAHVGTLRAFAESRELEAAIAQHPDDPGPRMVYGDWLLEQGDPRGELISVQRALASATGSKATTLRKKERALLADHSSLLYGTLDELLHLDAGSSRRVCRAEWNLGFFDEVELRLSEGGMPWLPKLSDATATLANLTTARFLRSLVLGGSASNYAPAIKQACALPKTLRSLDVTGQLWGEYTPGDMTLGDLAALGQAHPQLEVLKLKIGKDPLTGLALPNLRELDLWTNQLQEPQLAQLAARPWPKLHTLGLAVGTYSSVKPSSFGKLLATKTLPAIQTLRFGVVPDDTFAAALAKHAVALGVREVVLVNTDAAIAKTFEAAKLAVSTAKRET